MVGGILRAFAAGELRGSLQGTRKRGGNMAEQTTRPWKRILTDTGGQEIAEAAVVLPIVFLLLIGIMTFARAYNIYTTITYAAQEGARLAAQSSSASLGNTPSTATDVANRVAAVLQASSIDPGQIQTFTGTSALTSCGGGAPSCKRPKQHNRLHQRGNQCHDQTETAGRRRGWDHGHGADGMRRHGQLPVPL